MTKSNRWSLELALLATALIIIGLSVFFSSTAAVEASTPPSPLLPQEDQPSNAYCLSCHQQPNMTIALPSGEELFVTIDPELYGASAHGQENQSCVSCHTDITTFPHPENPEVQTLRDYTFMYQDACLECHEEQYDEFEDSVHAAALGDPNNPNTQNAPVCSDCHNPHTQPPLTMEEGRLDPNEGARIAQTCARCHNAIFEEFSESVHGAGVLEERNPDTPTCTDCHGVHQIEDPTTVQFRLASPDLCAECHTDPTMMAKYDLSTQVLDTYVADFHGTTVELFAATTPNLETNTPVCYDCHGVHNILPVDHPEKGLQIQENMLLACQRCHPDASDNFPQSWMSHYIASPTRYPIVYYVEWFYRLFIPGVIGGMAIFVLSDVGRKLFGRKRRSASPKNPAEKS